MTTAEVLKMLDTVRVLAPLVKEVHDWLDGDGDEPPALKTLPDQLQSDLAFERAKRRAGK